MTIHRITQTKKGRFALFDETGTFLFSVDGETLLKEKISEGTQLDAGALAALRAQSDLRKAKDKALGYLSLRDYAAKELYDKLCQKYDPDTAAASVAEMRRLDLLNDAAFAAHRAKYLAGQKKSVREIERQLSLKGIDRDIIADVLADLQPADDEACYQLLQKSYLRKLQAGETQKVFAAMARRGFSYGDIKAAVLRCTLDLDVENPEENGEW